jgi:predicted RecB family nuclease
MTEEQRRIFDTGHKVGKLAQELFPGGVEVDISSFGNLQEVVSHTEKLIEKGAETIYEAGFQFDEVLVLTDILEKGTDGWKIYEVKSSTGMKSQYILDTAVQYYVVSKSGLPVEGIYLVHINNMYVRSGEIDVGAMFNIQSVLESVLAIQDHVKDIIPELKTILQLDEVPHIDIGEYCHDPVGCDFTDYCWQHISQNSVLKLTRLGKQKKFELYRSGVLTLDQVPNDYPLNDHQRLQVESFKSQSVHIDRESIHNFLQDIHYPLYFLDFETYASAIPSYDNSRPYQQIPFQYSLHVKETERTELKHYEYLGIPQEDPRRDLIERLLFDIGEEGDIIVYNKGFETRILKELMQDFPEYEDEVRSIIGRVKDLMVPFQKRYYYTNEMQGSYSIKAVLSAMVPDLGYEDLKVSDGSSAMYAFEQLLNETDKNVIIKTRENLLEYCKRDTLAMVKVLEVLKSV